MKDKFRFPFIYPGRAISGKNSTILQIIIVLSSSILSSSAIATVAKAWLDNRKTKLTIQIDGSKKMLQYEGHHLNQDAATIQSVLSVLSKETTIATSIDVLSINMTDNEPKEAYLLTTGNNQKDSIQDASEQAPALQRPSLLKRLLPGWLRQDVSKLLLLNKYIKTAHRLESALDENRR